MEKLPISVIVVAKNAEKTIEACLSSIQRNKPAEIILVDGDSSDRTVEIAKRYTEKVYSDEGKGLSCARQLGANHSSQEYIAYVDSDVILMKDTLATMLTEFQGSRYVSMHAQEARDTPPSSYWEWANRRRIELRARARSEQDIGLAHSIFRRETILKYGFELGYGGWLDDVDLQIRLRKNGYKFGQSSALVHHVFGGGRRFGRDFGDRVSSMSFLVYRFWLGRLTPCHIKKWGPWNPGSWPPLAMLYWLILCLIKGEIRLIPYYLLDGIAKTAGMMRGFFD